MGSCIDSCIQERVHLGMTFTGADVPAATEHLTVTHQQAANAGVGRARIKSACCKLHGAVQIQEIGIGNHRGQA
jgi:hypothetical protein